MNLEEKMRATKKSFDFFFNGDFTVFEAIDMQLYMNPKEKDYLLTNIQKFYKIIKKTTPYTLCSQCDFFSKGKCKKSNNAKIPDDFLEKYCSKWRPLTLNKDMKNESKNETKCCECIYYYDGLCDLANKKVPESFLSSYCSKWDSNPGNSCCDDVPF